MLEVINSESGDWTVVVVNDVIVYEGHDGFTELAKDLAYSLGVRQINYYTLSDKEMEYWCLDEWRRSQQ